MGTVVELTIVIALLIGIEVVRVKADGSSVYLWTENPRQYASEGKRLSSSILEKISNSYLVTQCSYDCLRNGKCTAYNYRRNDAVCELLTETHLTRPGDIVDDVDSQYYLRDAFVIDENALGPCGLTPCHNGGVCLNLPTASKPNHYVCVCPNGWRGQNCTIKEKGTSWQSWSEWTPCSVTCGDGWKARHRTCVSVDTGATLSEFDCLGRAHEQATCNEKQCPYWGEWEEWSECSTHTTCGQGVAVRKRSCLNGGTAGKDRLCMGPINETTPCYRPDCTTPVRLLDGATHGEGQVEVLAGADTWGPICGNGWDKTDADVVCKQLGFSDGAAEAGTVKGQQSDTRKALLTDVTCIGTEATIAMCEHGGWDDDIECDSIAEVKCIVNGAWNTWQAWGECSVTCADGIRQRSRTCDYPPALRGGADCSGTDTQSKPCTAEPCPVDGEWEGWGRWTECSVTCGGGTRSRERTCHNPKYGGKACDTDIEDGYQEEKCNEDECPMDGVWASWSEWTTCTVTCGGGIRNRQRSCDGPKYGGRPCDEDNQDEDEESCNTDPCPIDGGYGSWSDWSACTLTCGTGNQVRTRLCDSPAPKYGGKECQGPEEEQQFCNTEECPVDGYWKEWSEWSECDVSCGGGTSSRVRTCVPPLYGGSQCEGPDNEVRHCADTPCPVDGDWSLWTRWMECSVTCGGGTQTRYRTCSGLEFGGKDCEGDNQEERSCNENPCPVDGEWEAWGEWGACDVTCGGGLQLRSRTCQGPFYGGSPCEGPDSEQKECGTMECPIDGVWLPWGEWQSCSVSCGFGTRMRNRTCDGPYYNGTDCVGPYDDIEQCWTKECPIDGVWKEWSDWSACSVTCGGGTQNRNRSCEGPYYGGNPCLGDATQTQQCNTDNCPIDGVWEEWSDWDTCSVSCGGGIQTRSRTCNGPFYGGRPCPGQDSETQDCNTQACPIDGVWEDWSDWAECSVTCGGGSQTRTRECQGPFYGGAECAGDSSQTQDCNAQNCPVDGVWLPWSEWSECTVTCGGGTQDRSRECEGPFFGGRPCDGPTEDRGDCNTNPCPIPGDWMEWGEWQKCSATCDGGTRTRVRECDLTVHGNLTIDCIGDNSHTEACNTYSCLPKPKTCGQMVERGMVNSDFIGLYLQSSAKSIHVFCDIRDGGITEVRHNFMHPTHVNGYEGPGEYRKRIDYIDENNSTISFSDVVDIVDASKTCKQYISWKCMNSAISVTKGNQYSLTWWRNRLGDPMYYWGDTDPDLTPSTRDLTRRGITHCSCFLNHTCDDPDEPCNCNKQDNNWHVDAGYITRMEDLPIREFDAGDTGKRLDELVSGDEEERGYFEVGPLLCSGVAEYEDYGGEYNFKK